MNDILDDLCCRFILNLPEEERNITERVCFQIELAHWFYEDFYREKDPSLPFLSFRPFCLRLFHHCPSLSHYIPYQEGIIKQFIQYKIQVPVCGVILLNASKTKCLMVRGWKSSSNWGFPKGKINQDESKLDCAIREANEEIGFDASSFIKESDYIEFSNHGQQNTFYIIQNIPESTPFAPQTKKEIGDIAWHPIDILTDMFINNSYHPSSKLYFMVRPAIIQLVHFIKARNSSQKSKRRAKKIVMPQKEEPAPAPDAQVQNQSSLLLLFERASLTTQNKRRASPDLFRLELEKALKTTNLSQVS